MVSKNDHIETIFNISVMVRDERKRGSSLKIPFKSLFGMFSPNLATEKSLEKDDDSCTNCFKFAMDWSLLVSGSVHAFPIPLKIWLDNLMQNHQLVIAPRCLELNGVSMISEIVPALCCVAEYIHLVSMASEAVLKMLLVSRGLRVMTTDGYGLYATDVAIQILQLIAEEFLFCSFKDTKLRKFTLELLERFGFVGWNHVSTLLELNLKSKNQDLYSLFDGFIEVITSPGEIVVDHNLFGEHPWLELIIKPVFSFGSLPRPPDLHSTVVSHMRIMAQSSPLINDLEMDYVFAGQGLCLPQELFGWLKSSTLVVIGSSRIEIHSDVVFALCATLELLLTQNLLQPHTMPNPLLYRLDCHGLVVQQSCSTHKPLLMQQWWLHYLYIGSQSMEQLRYGCILSWKCENALDFGSMWLHLQILSCV